jgi:hypothetical protein
VVPEQKMQSTTSRPVHSGRWQSSSMIGKPAGSAMPGINIEHAQPGGFAGARADQGTWVKTPQQNKLFMLPGGVLEAVRGGWRFRGQAGKARDPALDQPQRYGQNEMV